MIRNLASKVVLGVAVILSHAVVAPAEDVAVEDVVQPATHTVGLDRSPAVNLSAVTFAHRPARVGDRAAQTVGVELTVNTAIIQAGQAANEGKNSMQRRQQRFVEVLEVVDGAVRRAHVTYPLSRTTSSADDQPGQEVVQPVEQKSYFVTREGEQLLVRDQDNAIPSQAEFEIVVTGLKDLGLPNPLMQYLVGKTLQVGEQLKLPQATAERVMGFGGQFGRVEGFELTLKSVREIDGEPCAIFTASIEAVGEPNNPIRIHAFGEVVIQAETCRMVSAEISGPLTLSVAEHTPQGSYQYKAEGNMRLAVRSKYGLAPQ